MTLEALALRGCVLLWGAIVVVFMRDHFSDFFFYFLVV